MPDLRVGTAAVTAAKLGSTAVSKLYLGSTLIWPTATCTDVLSEPFNTLSAWTATTGSGTIVAGRTGTAVQFTAAAGYSFTIPALSESDTITVGFAWRTSVATPGLTVCTLHSDTNTTEHIRIRIASSGSLEVRRGSTTLGTTPPSVFTAGMFCYLELQVKLHDTAGAVVLRVNGVEKLNLTAVDTKNAGTKTTFDAIRIVGNAAVTNLFDDLYLSTGQGCAFKGDQSIPLCTDVLSEPFNNYTAWTTSGSPTIVAGRTGNAASIASNSQFAHYLIAAGSQADTITVGFAWRTTAFTNSPTICQLRNAAGVTVENSLAVATDGTLRFYRGTKADTLLGSSPAGAVAINTWHHIEVKAKLHDTAGYAVVRVNGVEVINTSAVDTRQSAAGALYDNVRLLSDVGSTHLFDDLYLSTGSGCAFQGDHTIP